MFYCQLPFWWPAGQRPTSHRFNDPSVTVPPFGGLITHWSPFWWSHRMETPDAVSLAPWSPHRRPASHNFVEWLVIEPLAHWLPTHRSPFCWLAHLHSINLPVANVLFTFFFELLVTNLLMACCGHLVAFFLTHQSPTCRPTGHRTSGHCPIEQPVTTTIGDPPITDILVPLFFTHWSMFHWHSGQWPISPLGRNLPVEFSWIQRSLFRLPPGHRFSDQWVNATVTGGSTGQWWLCKWNGHWRVNELVINRSTKWQPAGQ